jgi:hypothetical protein
MFGVSAADPFTFIAGTVFFSVMGWRRELFPPGALRGGVDPVVALRAD